MGDETSKGGSCYLFFLIYVNPKKEQFLVTKKEEVVFRSNRYDPLNNKGEKITISLRSIRKGDILNKIESEKNQRKSKSNSNKHHSNKNSASQKYIDTDEEEESESEDDESRDYEFGLESLRNGSSKNSDGDDDEDDIEVYRSNNENSYKFQQQKHRIQQQQQQQQKRITQKAQMPVAMDETGVPLMELKDALFDPSCSAKKPGTFCLCYQKKGDTSFSVIPICYFKLFIGVDQVYQVAQAIVAGESESGVIGIHQSCDDISGISEEIGETFRYMISHHLKFEKRGAGIIRSMRQPSAGADLGLNSISSADSSYCSSISSVSSKQSSIFASSNTNNNNGNRRGEFSGFRGTNGKTSHSRESLADIKRLLKNISVSMKFKMSLYSWSKNTLPIPLCNSLEACWLARILFINSKSAVFKDIADDYEVSESIRNDIRLWAFRDRITTPNVVSVFCISRIIITMLEENQSAKKNKIIKNKWSVFPLSVAILGMYIGDRSWSMCTNILHFFSDEFVQYDAFRSETMGNETEMKKIKETIAMQKSASQDFEDPNQEKEAISNYNSDDDGNREYSGYENETGSESRRIATEPIEETQIEALIRQKYKKALLARMLEVIWEILRQCEWSVLGLQIKEDCKKFSLQIYESLKVPVRELSLFHYPHKTGVVVVTKKEDKTCLMCNRPAEKVCEYTRSHFYCSQECRDKHWKSGHKEYCEKLLNWKH